MRRISKAVRFVHEGRELRACTRVELIVGHISRVVRGNDGDEVGEHAEKNVSYCTRLNSLLWCNKVIVLRDIKKKTLDLLRVKITNTHHLSHTQCLTWEGSKGERVPLLIFSTFKRTLTIFFLNGTHS